MGIHVLYTGIYTMLGCTAWEFSSLLGKVKRSVPPLGGALRAYHGDVKGTGR